MNVEVMELALLNGSPSPNRSRLRSTAPKSTAVIERIYVAPLARNVLTTVIARGDLLMMQARWRDAAAIYEHALPILEKSQGAGDTLASTWSSLCRAYVELQEPARALAPLERLANKLGEHPPDVRIAIQFTLARALWDTGGDHARAHELATQAFTAVQTMAGAHRDDIARMKRWLANHCVS